MACTAQQFFLIFIVWFDGLIIKYKYSKGKLDWALVLLHAPYVWNALEVD